jgi:hypothetical protein
MGYCQPASAQWPVAVLRVRIYGEKKKKAHPVGCAFIK